MSVLRQGDFIRVRRDLDDLRAGQDGMVTAPDDQDGVAGLTFYYDRYGDMIRSPCEGIEAWDLTELDLTTLER